MFLTTLSESEEEADSKEGSEKIGSKVDDLEERLERKLWVNSSTSRVMKCVGGILKILIKWDMWVKVGVRNMKIECKKNDSLKNSEGWHEDLRNVSVA